MKKITLILFLFSSVLFSQTVTTNFTLSGYLVDSYGSIQKSCKFKKKKPVIILKYTGNDLWQVKSGECIGYVNSAYLKMTPQLLNLKKEKIASVKREKDSIQKLREVRTKKVDSIKPIILDYAKNSLLIFSIENAKFKKEPSYNSGIFFTVKSPQEVILIDYINDFFKVKVNSKIGYMHTMYFENIDDINYDGASSLASYFRKATEEKLFELKKEELKKEELKKEELKKEKEVQKEKALESYFNECNYDTNEIDEFNGKVRKTTISYEIDKGEIVSMLRIKLKRFGNSKYISVHSFSNLGCVSPYSNNKSFVKFKLENNDIVTFYHIGDVDCGSFILLGRITSNDILRLKKSPIKSIRVSGTEYYSDIKNIYFKDFFIKKLDCIN